MWPNIIATILAMVAKLSARHALYAFAWLLIVGGMIVGSYASGILGGAILFFAWQGDRDATT